MSIKFDKKNYRKHSNRNKELINKSLSECGAGRSILIDNNDEIIAGNGIYEQAQKLNIPVKVIETDGSELVVVKRIDLATNDDKRKQLAIMDNSTSDSSEFDFELLQEDFDIDELNNLGLEIDVIDEKEIKIEEMINEIPDELKDINDNVDRIIIVFNKDENNKLAKKLNINNINKLFYEFKNGEII